MLGEEPSCGGEDMYIFLVLNNAAPWRADVWRGKAYPCVQSSKRAFSAKFMSASTSSWGRLKLSMAKAYTETTLMSREEHIPSIYRPTGFVATPPEKKKVF